MVIYGLRCPINHCIMYVGQTGHLRTRVVNHLCLGRRGYKGEKSEWIRYLMSAGVSPSAEVIERVPYRLADEREEYWIQHYKKLNPGLTNAYLPDRMWKRREKANRDRRYRTMFKGKAKAAEAIGIPAHVFARKIQPVMDDLGESERNPGIASDIFYDPIALDRWKAFLAQLDRRGGRAKALDYRSLYLAWLEGHNK